MYLHKVPQFRRNDENVRSERHLPKGLELLVIHVHLLHGRVQRVVTASRVRHAGAIKTAHLQIKRRNSSEGVLGFLPPLGQHVLQDACESVRAGAATTQNDFGLNSVKCWELLKINKSRSVLHFNIDIFKRSTLLNGHVCARKLNFELIVSSASA